MTFSNLATPIPDHVGDKHRGRRALWILQVHAGRDANAYDTEIGSDTPVRGP